MSKAVLTWQKHWKLMLTCWIAQHWCRWQIIISYIPFSSGWDRCSVWVKWQRGSGSSTGLHEFTLTLFLVEVLSSTCWCVTQPNDEGAAESWIHSWACKWRARRRSLLVRNDHNRNGKMKWWPHLRWMGRTLETGTKWFWMGQEHLLPWVFEERQRFLFTFCDVYAFNVLSLNSTHQDWGCSEAVTTGSKFENFDNFI